MDVEMWNPYDLIESYDGYNELIVDSLWISLHQV
jgi:hypothetical protein